MAVSVVAASGISVGTAPRTISGFSAGTCDYVYVIGMQWVASGNPTLSATYDGDGLTLVGERDDGVAQLSIFRSAASPASSGDVVLSTDVAGTVNVAAFSLSSVNTSDPDDTDQDASLNSVSPWTLNPALACDTGDLMLSAIIGQNPGGTFSANDGGMTNVSEYHDAGEVEKSCAVATLVTTGPSDTVSYSWTGDIGYHLHIEMVVNQAEGGSPGSPGSPAVTHGLWRSTILGLGHGGF